jgi:hypothetical protein
MENNEEKLWFRYTFVYPDQTKKELLLELDPHSLHLKTSPRTDPPAWTKLEFFQCPNCKLSPANSPSCPLALNIIDLIDLFKNEFSWKQLQITIETAERTYRKETDLQQGLSALMGIYMVTAGCPIMEKLKPMVRFHLPFATEFETKYRAVNMYLLAQFFRMKKGQSVNWDLNGLTQIYDEVRILNYAFCKRLQNMKIQDASINAVVILDLFADSVIFLINQETLNDFEQYYKAYFDEE